MRTRLDEIVEEAYPNWPGMNHLEEVKLWAKAIAERAFRHGVDQAAKTLWPEYYDSLAIGGVHPAPAAEEKPKPPYPTYSFECEDGKWSSDRMFVACSRCGIGMLVPIGSTGRPIHRHCFVDRRKGQRRTGLEWHRDGRYWDRPAAVDQGTSGADRRSGKDRRKP